MPDPMSEPIKPLDLDLDALLPPPDGNTSEDDVYAPADLDEASVTPCRSVPTLTNAPGCEPSGDRPRVRPVRRGRSARVDAWAVPASATWARPTRSGRSAARANPPQAGAMRRARRHASVQNARNAPASEASEAMQTSKTSAPARREGRATNATATPRRTVLKPAAPRTVKPRTSVTVQASPSSDWALPF